MFISLAKRHAAGFETWSNRRKPHGNDNDDPNHDNIGSMTDPDRDGTATAPSDQPHQPWHVPGIGASL
jgi:hypothetical protein